MLHLHLLGPLELIGGAGQDTRGVLTQPKRLAVLAFLAAREAGEFVRRDTLLGAFWPELSQHAARRSLRQTLHFLRSRLGAEILVTRGDDEVAVNPAAVECDVARFLGDLEEGHAAEALESYRGELLAGFFLTGGTAAFEHWLEEQASRLRALASRAAANLARDAGNAGDLKAAVAWERRALQIGPDDEAALRRLLALLERTGEEAAALRAYDAFARRISRELDHRPSPETEAIVKRLRATVGPAAAVAPAPAPASAAPPSGQVTAPPVAAEPIASSARRLRVLAPAALVIVLAAAAGAVVLARHNDRPRVLAVGEVRAGDGTASATATRILPDLIATDLARIGGLPVIPPTRLDEVAGYLHSSGRGSTPADAALAAGATDLIEGSLYRLAGDSLRLDLRIVGARSGYLRDALTLVGVDPFGLADSAAARFADRFGLTRPARPLVEVTSASPEAQALYQEGLRAFYRDGDDAAAARLFGDALGADSTFAMAAYYLFRSLEIADPEAAREALARAARMAGHATPREALLIRAVRGEDHMDPAWPALADSLAARYPDDPQGRVIAGEAHVVRGEFARAVEDFREAIRLDSLSLTSLAPRCLACDAYGSMISALLAEDSLPAAIAASRVWVATQPRSPRSWYMYSVALERAGRLDSALAARAKVDVLLGHTDAGLGVSRGYFAVRSGNLAAAESLLIGPASDPRDPQHADAVWWLVVALRNAGRPGAAIPWARRIERESAGQRFNEGSLEAMPLGEALFEAGRLAEAARVFESAGIHSAKFMAEYPGSTGRDRAWVLAQRATVAAAQGDTAALGWLADSVAWYGSASVFGRDRKLASYVRGLRLELAGRWAAAADSFLNAVYSPSEGYTRVNLELARTLSMLGRPAEAVRWLEAALRGGLEASNYYVTRTELEQALGDAFAALGQRDSAAAHYAWVARAWQRAEPPFRTRWAAARDYVAGSRRITVESEAPAAPAETLPSR